jgi:hypothetical protein
MAPVTDVPAKFFCDESGHTGADWGNPDQPYFVHGGWLVMTEREQAITTGFAALRRHFRLAAQELKWKHVSRRSNSTEIIQAIFDLVLTNECVPFFLVMDKNYITAAKVIETFFDPEYNHHLPMRFTWAFEAKKGMTEALLDARTILSEFAEHLRRGVAPDAANIRGIASGMAQHFETVGQNEFAAMLGDFTDDEVRRIQREFSAAAWLRATTGHSLWAIMQYLEGFLRFRDIKTEFIHDDMRGFDDLLDTVRGMLRPATSNDFHVVNGRPLYHNFSMVTDLRLADSKAEPFIQLADVLCGFLRVLFTKLKAGETLGPAEEAICLRLATIHDQDKTWDTNAPEELLRAFARSAFRRAPSLPGMD